MPLAFSLPCQYRFYCLYFLPYSTYYVGTIFMVNSNWSIFYPCIVALPKTRRTTKLIHYTDNYSAGQVILLNPGAKHPSNQDTDLDRYILDDIKFQNYMASEALFVLFICWITTETSYRSEISILPPNVCHFIKPFFNSCFQLFPFSPLYFFFHIYLSATISKLFSPWPFLPTTSASCFQ